MGIGGAFFVAGGLLNAFAQDIAMLVVGRLLLGVGVGEFAWPLARRCQRFALLSRYSHLCLKGNLPGVFRAAYGWLCPVLHAGLAAAAVPATAFVVWYWQRLAWVALY